MIERDKLDDGEEGWHGKAISSQADLHAMIEERAKYRPIPINGPLFAEFYKGKEVYSGRFVIYVFPDRIDPNHVIDSTGVGKPDQKGRWSPAPSRFHRGSKANVLDQLTPFKFGGLAIFSFLYQVFLSYGLNIRRLPAKLARFIFEKCQMVSLLDSFWYMVRILLGISLIILDITLSRPRLSRPLVFPVAHRIIKPGIHLTALHWL
jgi:hypothetical protein